MSITNIPFDFPYRKTYYIKHPILFIKECWWNLQAIWQRATKGHAWRDSAEMNEFLLYIIPSMLRDIANGEAYPGDEEFPTYESWQNFCNNLAEKFESAQEEKCYDKNEYNEQFLKAFDCLYGSSTVMNKKQAEEICKKFQERENEIYKERKKNIQEAFNILIKYYDCFWI